MSFYTFLPTLLNMSLTAGVAVLFVMLLRLLLRRAPKVISYALWAVVLFRLLCPVAVNSELSLFNLFDTPTAQSDVLGSSMEYVPVDIVHTEYPEVTLPAPVVSEAINEALPQGEEQLRADPLEAPMTIATYVWMAGVLAMAAYSAVTYIRLKRSLLASAPLRDNIYLADGIASPFVMGLIRPKIYLPSSLEEREQDYIILHEQHHIKRLDHIIKALAFAALCVHWFNPLVWLAFVLAGKDMEMSCDEAVIKKLGDGVRADYSASLLSLATGRRVIAGAPLAFGEGDTKSRIRNLANWRKPAFWVVLVAILACVALAVGLITNPAEKDNGRKEDAYYLRICAEGVMEVEVSTPNTSGGAIHADGSPFELGEEVWLEMLDGVTNLQGVSITAMNEDGEILYLQSFPESIPASVAETILAKDTWLILPEGLTLRWFSREYIEWFDYLDSPSDMLWDDSRTIETSTFPGVTFRWVPEEITAETESGTALLISGMPIWNAYLTDLNGDGMPEICATATFGSGIIDSRIIVHDYVAGETYTLEDRGEYDYRLTLRDGRLIVEQYLYPTEGAPIATGTLSLADDGFGGRELRMDLQPEEPDREKTEIIRDIDLDHDGSPESVHLTENGDGQMYTLNVVKKDGSVLWSKELYTPHMGWGTILLYERDGEDYLISYDPRMYQGDGDYDCTLFSLEGGRENTIETWSVDFDRVDFTKPMPISEEMQAFKAAVDPLLRESTLLVTTEQGELVIGPRPAAELPQICPVYFDMDEMYAAINTPENIAAARYAEMEALFPMAAFPYESDERVTGDWDGDGKEDSMGFKDEKRREFTVELSGSGTQSIRRIDTDMWHNGLVTEDSPWGWGYYFDTGDLDGDGSPELVFAIDIGTQGGDGGYCVLVCPTDGRGLEAFSQIETGPDYRLYWEGETDTVRIECEALGYEERITEESLIFPWLGTPEEAASRIAWMEENPDSPDSVSDPVGAFALPEQGGIITRQYVTVPGGAHSERYGYMLTQYAYNEDGSLFGTSARFVPVPLN